jgi:putative DNA primase/helicase
VTEFSITQNKNNLQQALDLAALGWYVFPCQADKKPALPSAHPEGDPLRGKCRGECGKKGHGFHDATNNPEEIRKLWDQYPGALIGIACEKSGIFAVDIDHKNGVDGWRSWTELVETYGAGANVACGPAQQTPSGGAHLIFKYPPDLKIPNNAGKLSEGLDLRSNGYICTGGTYQWLDQHGPDSTLTEAPGWLIERIRKLSERPAAAESPENLRKPESILDPGPFWLSYYLKRTAPGRRNEDGFYLACQMRDSGLSEAMARPFMVEYANRVPPKPGDPYTESQALASLQSAYSGPVRSPAALPGVIHSNGHTPTNTDIPNKFESIPATDNPQTKQRRPTDDELRDRYLAQAPLTAYGLGEWRRYKGGVWPEITEDQIAAEILEVIEGAKGEGVRPSKNLLASVMELVRLKVAIADDRWDATPSAVVCKNGVFDILTGTLAPHQPENYHTSALGFDYDPAAAAKVWNFYLESIQPDNKYFIQEYAGYCLTPDTKFELALWLYGPRGSGKSTLIEGFQAMLGDRTTLLGLSEVERSRFALYNLRGKTLAVASEQPALYVQSSHLINRIISGELLTIERKFRDPIDVRTHVKILWAMNELPRLPDAGDGLFRRVKVIKFPPLPEKDQDPKIKEAIKLEGAGILNWALEGLQRLHQRGCFEIPKGVRSATEHFQQNNDIPAVFVAECCLTGPDYKIQSSQLYEKYKAWCLDNGHKPQSSTALAEEWERLGFEKKKAPAGMFWYGVGVKAGEPEIMQG